MMINRHRKTLVTDSGMHCIWDPCYFSNINNYDSWERELLEDEDILQHIDKGKFVPINIHSDGAFEFEVRVGTSEVFQQLSECERKYLIVSSEEYRFVSNGYVCISGIEYICNNPDENIGCLSIDRGDYSVTVHLIGWDDEPGMREPDGTPKVEALPDFIIIMNPSLNEEEYRVDLNTFPDQA
ncbi:hypothetical protein [Candidatus Clostridium stratigraminis]|uniref:Uncharacterized protein n=1 Tax=Candidatus Clostridium stratigraminis TaxID=3381661 RepID=A0ABW8T1R0_9CLOT